jgi:dihydrofolate synthase/folylpolyglutamate synthase
MITDNPVTICDIGHNEHGLKYNFAQLERMKASGEYTHLIIVYGSVADKDVNAVIHLMPEDAVYIFTQAHGKRALPAKSAMEKYMAFCEEIGRQTADIHCIGTVVEARRKAEDIAASIVQADPCARPLIYIGGSTYVVSEAVADQ